MYVNAGVREYVEECYAPSAPAAVLHHAVPYADNPRALGRSVREVYPIPPGARVLVFVGQLVQARNLDTLIEGFALASIPDWVLAVIGGGPLLAHLRHLAGKRGCLDRVFLGEVLPNHEVVGALSGADAGLILLQPVGFNRKICTPNKLFEYTQARLPIMASRLPMIEKSLAENGNGTCGDVSSPQALAGFFARFIDEELPRFKPEVLERAARALCWENEEPKLLELVGRVESRAGGRD
jgi:glycosyltransferase involved in cell wall biosynthesis